MSSLDEFGQYIFNIIHDDELTDKQKTIIILTRRDEIDLTTVDDITPEEFISILRDIVTSNIDLGKVGLFLPVSKPKTKKRKLQVEAKYNTKRRKILNKARSFNLGRPCMNCNKIADYFNRKGILIHMPDQHDYGQCPMYCNICPNYGCSNPEEHLSYKCDNCNSSYCNHPTEVCRKT
jgi:hypothetical protein